MAVKLNVKNLRLKDELGNFLALIKLQLEELTQRATAPGPKDHAGRTGFKGITDDMVALTKCFESATRSKIALDKAEAKHIESMTPEEELEEIKDYLLEFDHKERLDIINELITRHNKKCLAVKKPFLIREVDNGK